MESAKLEMERQKTLASSGTGIKKNIAFYLKKTIRWRKQILIELAVVN